MNEWFKSTRPGSRWCQSTFNEDLLFGLALLSVPSVGTLGCAITVNKVIQPWCDLDGVGNQGQRWVLREFTKNSTGRLVWACCLMADTQSALREGHQCPRSLSVTMLAQQKVVGDETSDIAMDDTAWLVHERTRKKSRQEIFQRF